ncbi:NYN domain-containing protein [Dactylosporangium sp. NBC_01737]|uniref:NYN domain-containing protein n=1 Tax=Dactylosporangium sp. NBC_01737 TaxID=2975959 RepID=UPI002E147423|nr:NYN domain-containing protein [Dactylosporangium sp. NBC_01737]
MLWTVKPRCSLYVDVGYLLSAAAVRVTGTSFRNGIQVDYEPLIDALVQQAEALSELPVLRVHWYDSATDGVPDNQQQFIGELPNVKLRLGRFGFDGQQKGVDLRIGLDLVAHARNGAADVFILVSGDDDLTEAVEEAQVHGVQVILLAVPNADDKPHGISRHLIRAADGLKIIFPDTIDQSVTKVQVPPTAQSIALAPQGGRPRAKATSRDLNNEGVPGALRPPMLTSGGAINSEPPSAPAYEDPAELAKQIDSVVDNVLLTFRRSATPEALAELTAGKPSIPRDVDKALLTDLSDRRGGIELSEAVRHKLRAQFWEKYDEA